MRSPVFTAVTSCFLPVTGRLRRALPAGFRVVRNDLCAVFRVIREDESGDLLVATDFA
jgi:hypothetical protein